MESDIPSIRLRNHRNHLVLVASPLENLLNFCVHLARGISRGRRGRIRVFDFSVGERAWKKFSQLLQRKSPDFLKRERERERFQSVARIDVKVDA